MTPGHVGADSTGNAKKACHVNQEFAKVCNNLLIIRPKGLQYIFERVLIHICLSN